MASVLCSHCGNNNPPEARFCANCGSSLEVPLTPVPVAAAAPATAPAAPAAVTEYASFWIRFAAFLIDWVIIIGASFFLRIITISFMFILSPILIACLYYWLFTGLKGQTPGKIAVGIKVVDDGGSIPGLGIAILREILGKIVSFIVFCLGYLWIIWDVKKQGLHDKIAGTYVVPVKPRR